MVTKQTTTSLKAPVVRSNPSRLGEHSSWRVWLPYHISMEQESEVEVGQSVKHES